MQILTINVVLAVLPALYLLVRFYRKDTYQREPGRLVIFACLTGIAVIFPVALLETVLASVAADMSLIGYALFMGFVTAALVEETSKYLVVVLLLRPRSAFDETTDGIVYTIAASMGFALFENIMYSAQSPVTVALLRGITAVPLHAVASGIMGYYIGAAKFETSVSSLKGLVIAVMIHGLYNFLLMTQSLLGFLIIPLLWSSWKHLNRLYRRAQLEDRYYGRS
ncbi:MAG: PrsW family intramembrane metalloprotease [Spirochaetota bacterium]